MKRKSPYNTYLHKGLPPGPINSPGRKSILAALYPEENDFLFFVAKGDDITLTPNVSDLATGYALSPQSVELTDIQEDFAQIFTVTPLKPTGAGDAFMGALIGALLKDYDIEKSIEIGSAAAAIVVTKVGCSPAMPDLEEILEFMKDRKISEGEE